MNIRESYQIEDAVANILKSPDLEKFITYFDFDNTLVKLDKHYNNPIGNFGHVGSDAWYGSVLTQAIKMLNNNILLAFGLTTTINDTVQNFIHLKAAEKNTTNVINQLQALDVPVVIVTARGYTLAKRTQEQLEEANIKINHEWLKSNNKKEPVELSLKYPIYSYSSEPEDIIKLGYKFSYVYIKESNRLFYFNRFRNVEEININNPQFKNTLDEILKNKNQTKLSKEEIISLTGNSHQPEKHVVVFHENVLYCEGQNKGEAIDVFNEWAGVDKECTVMVDDKKNNIEDVEKVITQSGKKFFGIHYKRVKENFDLNSSREELKNLYPYLPVKTRAAMIEIKLSDNAMSFFAHHKKVMTQSSTTQFVNELKTSMPKMR